MNKEIFFVRHGQTDYNLNHIVQGSGIDSSLNSEGRNQAEAFFDFYKNEGFELVYTSALKRTKETVQQFLDLNIPHIQSANLNEINWGIHEGKPRNPELIAAYKKLISDWDQNKLDASLKDGESARQLISRCNQFIEELLNQPQKKILVCSHGRTLRCMMSVVHREHPREMEKYEHNNTGLFLINWMNQQFETIKLNDIGHLAQVKKR